MKEGNSLTQLRPQSFSYPSFSTAHTPFSSPATGTLLASRQRKYLSLESQHALRSSLDGAAPGAGAEDEDDEVEADEEEPKPNIVLRASIERDDDDYRREEVRRGWRSLRRRWIRGLIGRSRHRPSEVDVQKRDRQWQDRKSRQLVRMMLAVPSRTESRR